MDIDKLNLAIDHSKAGDAEKAEAKSLLRKVFENKLVRSAIETWFKSKFPGAGGS